MTDRVYPASKSSPPTVNVNGGPPKITDTNTNQTHPRPIYRPQQNRQNKPTRSCSGRKCCCLTFLYILITLIVITLLAAIAASIFYVLYHPKPPVFNITSIRTVRFNVTQPDPTGFGHLNSRFDVTLSAKNPNKKKITFMYSTIDVDTSISDIDISTLNAGNATLPAFTHVAGNTSVLHATVTSDVTKDLDSDIVSKIRLDMKKKSGFPITFVVNTFVEVQIGKIKSKKVNVRVICNGIKAGLPPKNVTSSKNGSLGVISSNAKCKVDLRFKIWKFTI